MNDTPHVISARMLIAAQRGDGYARRRVRRLEINARQHMADTPARAHSRRTRAQKRAHQADRRHSRRQARQALHQITYSARNAG